MRIRPDSVPTAVCTASSLNASARKDSPTLMLALMLFLLSGAIFDVSTSITFPARAE